MAAHLGDISEGISKGDGLGEIELQGSDDSKKSDIQTWQVTVSMQMITMSVSFPAAEDIRELVP